MVKDMSTFLSPNINAKGNKLVIEYEEDMNSEIISDINRIR